MPDDRHQVGVVTANHLLDHQSFVHRRNTSVLSQEFSWRGYCKRLLVFGNRLVFGAPPGLGHKRLDDVGKVFQFLGQRFSLTERLGKIGLGNRHIDGAGQFVLQEFVSDLVH